MSWFQRRFYLNVKRPSWCKKSDQLYGLFANSKQLLTDGVVVWAHLVQANRQLFEPGEHDCPASVVFAPNPRQVVEIADIGQASKALYQLKGTEPSDPDLKEFAENITDEYVRTFGLKLPDKLFPGAELYEATTFVSRKHLPNGVLTLGFFPLLVAQHSPYYNIPQPSRYWPEELIRLWLERAR
ncbi:MAG: hypothetical protein AAF483_19255 [Planctomycetota bacterium]